MNLGVIGSGYVGLVVGSCFAESGNDVICVDKDPEKIAILTRGEVPIYEPGLKELIQTNSRAGRLSFTTDVEGGVKGSEIIFVAVGTPEDRDGSADLKYVLEVARGIGKFMNGPKIIVLKSTVPVGTADLVKEEVKKHTTHEFDVVSNPEFLKEGSAIDDFMKPDRVVIGASTVESAEVMRELYAPFVRTDNPVLVMDNRSAELTKYAANALLATKVTFMNEIANLCETVGGDVTQVRRGIGSDSRIGPSFLFPGVGYGGSCFPKDVRALSRIGVEHSLRLQIVEAVDRVNTEQKKRMVKKISTHFPVLRGKHFALWGLAFKPKTDDVREAPSLTIIEELIAQGATVCVYDPEAVDTAKIALRQMGLYGDGKEKGIRFASSNYDALSQADALIIVTEWNEFRRPNFSKMSELLKSPVIFDGRNLFEPAKMRRLGFVYHSVGRPTVGL